MRHLRKIWKRAAALAACCVMVAASSACSFSGTEDSGLLGFDPLETPVESSSPAESEETQAQSSEESSEASPSLTDMSGYTQQEPSLPDVGTLARTGERTLSLAIVQPSSLLPWKVTDRETAFMLRLSEDSLFETGSSQEMSPSLAESYSFSQDGYTVDIILRQDAVFHNGNVLTSSDVVYTIQQLKSTNNYFSSMVSNIASATAMDVNWVQITFVSGGLSSLSDLVFPIVPDGYAQDMVPMGTGPYQYASMQMKREMTLTANASYFGGAPSIQTVVVYFVTSSDQIETCFDVTRTNLYSPALLKWGNYVNDTDKTIFTYHSREAVYLEFNQNSSYSQSLSNRQKVAYAVDASSILRQVYWGQGTVTETLLEPHAYYQGMADTLYGADLDKASRISVENTDQVTVFYEASDSLTSSIAPILKEELEAAGLTVNLVQSGDYDIALRRSQVSLKKAADYVGLGSEVEAAVDEAGVTQAATDIRHSMQETLPVYALFYLNGGTVAGSNLTGTLEPSGSNGFNGVGTLK